MKLLWAARIAMNQNDGSISFFAVGYQLELAERIHLQRFLFPKDFDEF